MKKYNIVVVENDEDEQFFMKEGFDEAGLFNLLNIVSNGDVLFEWLDANRPVLPDLVLSDLNMPGKNGYDIIAEMKNTPAYRHIPVFITSTSSTPSIIAKCISMGAADYLVKPETFIEYASFIEHLHGIFENYGKRVASE